MSKIICRRWAVDISTCSPNNTQLAQAISAVQPEERTRLMKFVYWDDFYSSMVGRLLMRKFVSDSTGIAYHDVQFGRDSRGKPYLQNVTRTSVEKKGHKMKAVSFNVSHQGDFVVLAGLVAGSFSDSAPERNDFGVGVDVMKIEYSGGKPLAEFFRLMKNKFADNEWQYINRCQNQHDQLHAFMRHWCLKESYVKELGLGITINLQKISFTLDPEAVPNISGPPLVSTVLRCDGVHKSDWHFEEHLIHPNYCAAIAFRNCRPEAGNFECLSIADLLVKNSGADDAEIADYCKDVLKKPRKK